MTLQNRCALGGAVLLCALSAATIPAAAAPMAVRAGENSVSRTPVIRYGARGLVIDVGRFLPAGQGVRVLLGHPTSGRRRIRVDVDRPGRKGIHVDVTVPVGKQTDDRVAAPIETELGPADTLPDEKFLQPDENRGQQPNISPVRAPKPQPLAPGENYIGLFAAPLPTALRTQLAETLSAGQGLLVTHVVPNSPAANAGIKPYDVLLSYNGRSIQAAAELKRLVIGDRLGRSVVLEIIHAARRQNITIVLEVRTLVEPHSQTFRLGTARGARWFRLRGRQVIAPGPMGRANNKPDEIVLTKMGETHSFSIRCNRDRVCHLRVRYVGTKGQAVRQDFTGTIETLREKVASLPLVIRSRVLTGLKTMSRDAKKRPTFRFQLQPSIQRGRQILRLVIGRTTSDGVRHLFQLEQTLAGRGQISVNDLLKNEALAEELQQLSPTIRVKVIATLHRVRFPRILVKVRNSL